MSLNDIITMLNGIKIDEDTPVPFTYRAFPSPAEFGFLTSTNSAVAFKEEKAVAEAAPKKATKKK